MKELTIEQKAKAYDRALEKSKEFYILCKKCGAKDTIDFLEDNFPELCEPDDEKIRKTLLRWIQSNSYTNIAGMPIKNIIAWLEKQGYTKKDVDDAYLKGICDAKHELEKQGEQESDPREENLEELLAADDIYQMAMNNDMVQEAKTKAINALSELQIGKLLGLENQGEQKPTDNNEQKFHEGDWIIGKTSDLVYHVDSVLFPQSKCYYLSYNGETVLVSFADVQNYRLWTIEDAKDGDVLCTYECCEPKIVFILKGTPKKHYALSYHCYYNIMYPHFGSDSEKGCLAPKDEDVKPATKEQSDTLFSKMKEAGYEWDSEKKELKKIEQSKLTAFEEEVKDMMDDYRDAIDDNAATTEEVKEHAAYLLSLIPHKPADWSEEDELKRSTLIHVVKKQKGSAIFEGLLPEELINWLMSIKQRIGG